MFSFIPNIRKSNEVKSIVTADTLCVPFCRTKKIYTIPVKRANVIGNQLKPCKANNCTSHRCKYHTNKNAL